MTSQTARPVAPSKPPGRLVQVRPVDPEIDALRDLMLAAQEFRHVVAANKNLSLSDSFAVSYLASNGRLSAQQLAELLGTATSTVTTIIDRIEDAGLAARARDRHDRRVVWVQLTPRGVATLRDVRAAMRAALDELGDPATPTGAMLSRLAEGLRRQAATFDSRTSPTR